MFSRSSKSVRWIVITLSIIVIIGSAFVYAGSWFVTAIRVSQVFANTYAAQMCAGLFISGRSRDTIYNQSFLKKIPPDAIYSSLSLYANRGEGRVTVDGWLVSPVTAVYAGRRGCVLLPEGINGNHLASNALKKPGTYKASKYAKLRLKKVADFPKGVKSQQIDEAIANNFADRSHNTHSFLVYHNGQLIREAYRGIASPEVSLESWAFGKLLVNALTGNLLKEGKLSLDETISISQWPNANDPRRAIRIRDLLHMASGLDFSTKADFFPVFEQSDHALIYTNLKDIVSFSANRQLVRKPGTLGNYNNGDVLLLMEHIRQKFNLSHQQFIELIEKKIFTPLGMSTIRLSTDYTGNPVITGYVYGSAIDWGKLALIYAGQGEHNGYRLFSKEFYNFIRKPSPNSPATAYGGMIWLNNNGLYEAPKNALVIKGAGDQAIIISPDENLVIVRMGHLNKSKTTLKIFNESLKKIFGAFSKRYQKEIISPNPTIFMQSNKTIIR